MNKNTCLYVRLARERSRPRRGDSSLTETMRRLWDGFSPIEAGLVTFIFDHKSARDLKEEKEAREEAVRLGEPAPDESFRPPHLRSSVRRTSCPS